ncbi:MAG: hypothetical protein WA876_09085 [Candidatus Acidiferrales bacterium]
MAQAASTYLGEQRRRSTRLEQTSSVIIRGVDLLGQPFEERAAAQNLSFHGCRCASKHHLPKNTWITLEVPSGESRGDATCMRARVAWIQRPRTQRDLFEVGVELEKGKNVWGVTFPPNDWSGGAPASAAAVTTMSISAETGPRTEQGAALKVAEHEPSLEVYLQMAMAHTNRDFAVADGGPETVSAESGTLLEQLRQEFLTESKKMIAEARAAVDEAVKQKASELQDDFEGARGASAEVFHKQWLEEFEHGKVDAKEEIASALAENVAAQLASFQEQVRGTLTSEWAEKLSHAQVERSRWEAEMQALREEVRASVETTVRRSDERWNEKLMEVWRELESSRMASTATDVTATERPSAVSAESVKNQLLAEADTARAQWNELLESSLDSAAQRLNERLTSGSQELLRRAEQELAKRLAEFQKETGLTAETSRATLGELKAALESEVAQAKTSLGEIEQTAGRFSEYSRQLDAASQDSLNELRQRLESSVTQQCAGLDRHAVELEGKFSKRAALLLEQMSRETVTRSTEEIRATVASGLESATKAAEELSAREEQAEGILRIHRERLRQVSEQVQRESATHLTSGLTILQKDLEGVRAQALAQWKADLEANGARAAEEASAALAKETARQLVEADAQLLVQTEQAIDAAQERMHKNLHAIAGKFRGELGEMEASQLGSARENLALAAQDQLDSAKNEFTKAAEKAASTFGEVIEEAAESALQDFSAASEAQTAQDRARLVAAAENALQGIQSHAQSSFEHFQEQLAVKMEQALKHASETLAHQFEASLEKFQAQGEARLGDWSAKQASLSEQALEKHDAQLQAASGSWVESTLEQLDARSEERVHSAVRATENAVRQACADIFDSVAQTMKKQLQGALEMRHAAPGGETNPQEHSQEHRASA